MMMLLPVMCYFTSRNDLFIIRSNKNLVLLLLRFYLGNKVGYV